MNNKQYHPILTVGTTIGEDEDENVQKILTHIIEPKQSPQNVGLLLSLIMHAFVEVLPESEQVTFIKKVKSSFTKTNKDFYDNITAKIHTYPLDNTEE